MEIEVLDPQIDEISFEHQWSGDNGRWLKIYDVYLVNRLNGKQIGDTFWVIVCSQKFIDNPTSDYSSSQLKRAIVQDFFSEADLMKYLQKNVDTIGPVQSSKMFSELDAFLIGE